MCIRDNIKAALEYVPEWKQKLIFNITNYLHCPIHIAKEVARVDKLNWQIHSNDILNDSEKILVDWVSKTAKKQKQTALSIEYLLDRATLPHFHATYRKNK